MSEGEHKMRAKMHVGMVQELFYGENGAKSGETLTMHAVGKNSYDETGRDEDNTFAKYTPGATLTIQIANPDLWGKFAQGDTFYVDFTSAPK